MTILDTLNRIYGSDGRHNQAVRDALDADRCEELHRLRAKIEWLEAENRHKDFVIKTYKEGGG